MDAILAIDSNGGIGKNGTIPWSSKEDMRSFSLITQGRTCVMGRKTWEDLKFPKPLKDRLSVVITTNLYDTNDYPNTVFLQNADFDMIEKYFYQPILIGGASLFHNALMNKKIDTLMLSVFDKNYKCDTFIDYNYIRSVGKNVHEENYNDFVLQEWEFSNE